MTSECTLCGLPTPREPVTDAAVAGEYCCRGCLEVSRAVGEGDLPAATDVRDRSRSETSADAAATDPDAEAFLAVDGMHCATCETFLELRGRAHDAVASVEASYATESVRVEFDAAALDREELPAVLSGYGYTARLRDGTADAGADRDEETLRRLFVGGVLAFLIMPWYVFYIYPTHAGFGSQVLTVDMTTPVSYYLPMTFVALLAGGVVGYTGWPILRGAYVSLRARRPNMDLLLAVAILAAYAYSTIALARGSHYLYYDVSVAIVLVVTAGNYYERRVKRSATSRLSELTRMQVSEATRRTPDGDLMSVDVDTLQTGDEVLVRPGERVPVDGTVRDGVAAVDDAVVTGESVPRTRRPGDEVVGGSVVTDSALVVAVGEGARSTVDRIASLLWAAQSERSGVERFADRLAAVFVPIVLAIATAVLAWRLSTGEPASTALLSGLTVLVVSCPCAMGLATPLAVAGGLRDALDRGLVVTNGALFEAAPDVDTVIFDKTGTLTTGEMAVRSVAGEEGALRQAAAVERRSSHPVARAIVTYVGESDGSTPDEPDGAHTEPGESRGARNDDGRSGNRDPEIDGGAADSTGAPARVSGFERHPGAGVSGRVDGERVVVGAPDMVEREAGELSSRLRRAVRAARASGEVPVVVGRGDRAVAVATVGDRDREGWRAVLEQFADEEVVILTGDDARATARFRDHPAVDRVFADVPPEGKAQTVRTLGEAGTTAMIGDGTNDAPALGAADVGVAVAGTAHAADAADVVVFDGSLTDVPTAFELATATRGRIRENVAWALCYNGVAIPLAVSGVINPLFAAVAMAASSAFVVTNSRRSLL